MKKNYYTLLVILVLLVFAGTFFMLVGCDNNSNNDNGNNNSESQPPLCSDPYPTSLVIRYSGNIIKLKQGNSTEQTLRSKMSVKVEMSDKTMQTVTDYTITDFDPELLNRPQAVNVHYGDLYNIVLVEINASEPVAPTITKITVDKTKIELSSDNATVEQIKSSITVKAFYSDNSEKVITDYTVEGFDEALTEPQTITIKSGNFQAQLTVEIKASKPDIPDENDVGQYIFINDVKYNLVVNTATDKSDGRLEEYMGTFDLKVGDKIVLKNSEGHEYKNYESNFGFNGSVQETGKYTFYVKVYTIGDSIWVELAKE